MRFFFPLASVSFVCGSKHLNEQIRLIDGSPSTDQIDDLFNQFVEIYDKQYFRHEIPEKKQAFAETVIRIIEHSASEATFEVGINEYSDLTRKAFRDNFFKGFIPNEVTRKSFRTATQSLDEVDGVEVAKSVDWREHGAVTGVKNQGQCGSCWAFSTTGALEGVLALNTGKLVSLSEEQLIECINNPKTGKPSGCNGGLMDFGFSYTEDHNLATEADYPYIKANGQCDEASLRPNEIGIKKGLISNYVDVKVSVTALKKAVQKNPVAVAIDASQESFSEYTSGIYTACSYKELDHGVLLVGYGSDNGQDYWIVKNSWGESWGDEGYIYIEMASEKSSDPAMSCGITLSASYPEYSG